MSCTGGDPEFDSRYPDMAYTPSKAILDKYARLIVHFALGGGAGLKKGDVVCLTANEMAKPLYLAVQRAVWDAGGHVIPKYFPAGEDRYSFSKDFFERAKPHQLDHFPRRYFKGLVDDMDHLLFILADEDPQALQGIDPKKLLRRSVAFKPYRDWRTEKEHKGKFHWCIVLYGTPGMAKEAGLSEKEYWNQIIRACFLDKKDPIAEWKRVYRDLERYRKKLNTLSPKIERLHVEGSDADLWVQLGTKRQWLSGRGANIPSFEIFTSPDWRGTDGWIRFNQPLYYEGNLIKGIELWFERGRVVKAKARTNEKLLKEMIATPNADKVGEFSLTDRRFSRITKFMAETLFDENIGGPQGNTHIALGAAYADAYAGDVSTLTKKQKEYLGFNDSAVHTDIISTVQRTVTAHLTDGTTKVIYKNGQFVL